MALSIGGLGSAIPESIRPRTEPRAAPGHEQAHTPSSAPARPHGDPAANESAAVSAEGVDGRLWSLLSSEERSYYLRNSITSPATYDRQASSRTATTPAARLGGRLDVRV